MLRFCTYECLIVIVCTLIIQLNANHDCPWRNESTRKANIFMCMDRHHCNGTNEGWDCCLKHGGRAKCPSNFPKMCQRANECGNDYCCMGRDQNFCQSIISQGLRPCHGASMAAGETIIIFCIVFVSISAISSVILMIGVYKAMQKEEIKNNKMLLRQIFFMSVFDLVLVCLLDVYLVAPMVSNISGYKYASDNLQTIILFFAFASQTSYTSISIQIFMDLCNYHVNTCGGKVIISLFVAYIITVICLFGYSIWFVNTEGILGFWPNPLMRIQVWIPLFITMFFSSMLLMLVFYRVFFQPRGNIYKSIMAKTSVIVGIFVVTWSFAFIFTYEMKYNPNCPWWFDAMIYLCMSFPGIGNVVTWLLYFKDIRSSWLESYGIQKFLLPKNKNNLSIDSTFTDKILNTNIRRSSGVESLSYEWMSPHPDKKEFYVSGIDTRCSISSSSSTSKRASIIF